MSGRARSERMCSSGSMFDDSHALTWTLEALSALRVRHLEAWQGEERTRDGSFYSQLPMAWFEPWPATENVARTVAVWRARTETDLHGSASKLFIGHHDGVLPVDLRRTTLGHNGRRATARRATANRRWWRVEAQTRCEHEHRGRSPAEVSRSCRLLRVGGGSCAAWCKSR
jgi:hypothetical protein